MSRVSLKRLTRIWQEESAGKTKQMLEACRRRTESRSVRGTARKMGLAYSLLGLAYSLLGLAGPHARGKSWQALRPQVHRQEKDVGRRHLDV